MIAKISRPFNSEPGYDGRFACVPTAMIEVDRWAVAGKETVGSDGKPTVKVPHNARTGRRARSDDPATWSSFDAARAVVDDSSTPFDRLYFMTGGGFGAVDFDGVIADGEVHPAVKVPLIPKKSQRHRERETGCQALQNPATAWDGEYPRPWRWLPCGS